MASNNQDMQGMQGGASGGMKSGKSNRGFASMDPERQRQIASEGGRAAHEKGTAHEFTSEEAREAGRKGGMARSANRSKANQSNQGNQPAGGNSLGSNQQDGQGESSNR
ncbi:KGG domain-containing protein [Ramlibacter albus]|uniref:Conidiation-specific protein 10 n=1 Tax=Ramlibacter albus TaxID=2079448 RepID=A0A923M8W1_9BURK|nr:KGG domain-containing protein [Ramlibacter albus]MBC5765043.1 conidiation-specific protein 10 [Ramlibacter albus]